VTLPSSFSASKTTTTGNPRLDAGRVAKLPNRARVAAWLGLPEPGRAGSSHGLNEAQRPARDHRHELMFTVAAVDVSEFAAARHCAPEAGQVRQHRHPSPIASKIRERPEMATYLKRIYDHLPQLRRHSPACPESFRPVM
jgi:hypothetical protein